MMIKICRLIKGVKLMGQQVIYNVVEKTIRNGQVDREYSYYSYDKEYVDYFVNRRSIEMQSRNMIRRISDSDYAPYCVICIVFMQRYADVVYMCQVFECRVEQEVSQRSARDLFGRM